MLVLVGMNFRSAPLAIRERAAIDEASLADALRRLKERPSVQEAVILSTCNRVEVLVRVDSKPDAGVETVHRFLVETCGLSADELTRHSYRFVGSAAVRHLFAVAGGLDSMIIGEPQILGQVKQAYLAAHRHHGTGPVLERLMQHGLATGKRIRRETGISENPVSVAYAAVELARNIFGKLAGRRALLLGAGKMSDLVAQHLIGHGVSDLSVCSRTYARAAETAERHQGRAISWDDGVAGIRDVDIVVSCTGALRPVLTRAMVAQAVRARRGQPLFLIDIAVPRDVEPSVNELDNVYLYDIDGLTDVVDSNLEERKRAAELARRVVDDEAAAFERWRQAEGVGPMIVALREGMLEVARESLDRHRGKLGALTPEQFEALDRMNRALVQKILHRPIQHLRRAAERGDVEATRKMYGDLFGIDEIGAEADATNDADDGADEDTSGGPTHMVQGGKDN